MELPAGTLANINSRSNDFTTEELVIIWEANNKAASSIWTKTADAWPKEGNAIVWPSIVLAISVINYLIILALYWAPMEKSKKAITSRFSKLNFLSQKLRS